MNNTSLVLLQAACGAFFAISGYHKLANRERHAELVKTLRDDGVPLVSVNQWWVPFWELTAGALLAVGIFPALSAAVLLVICIVACYVDGLARIRAYHPIDKADWFDDLLYLPETLYAVMLTAILIEHLG